MGVCRASVVLAIALFVAACSRERGLRCESDERYRTSVSIPPLQIPEGLTVPDETEALRIPDPRLDQVAEPDPDLPCLESPPDFFEDTTDSA